MTHTIQPGERLNVLWAGSDTTKSYLLEVDVVDGVAVPKLAEIKLPTRQGIYSPGAAVSTDSLATRVRLLMLTRAGWYWLDPTASQEQLTPTDPGTVAQYLGHLIPVALYGELEG